MIIIIGHFNLHAHDALEIFLYMNHTRSYFVQLLVTDSYIRYKFNMNIQTHHNIKTAYRLMPGMFYRIFLFKKNVLYERQKLVEFRISRFVFKCYSFVRFNNFP